MTYSLLPARFVLLAALAVGIGQLPAAEQSSPRSDPQVKDLEKQIADLQARLEALKKRELLPAPRELIGGSLPDAWVNPMQWRCIGPAIMGGRITALAVVENEPSTYWVATASGGLLHTANNGVTFTHQFERESTVSLGAVAVAPSHKNIVWVGTGEANPRNSVSYGDGVFKSTDGGKTWKNMGLKQSYQVGKIVIHPKNPDIVYVGALGRLYGPNPERGLFKTTDGGKTWQRLLFVDGKTGVIDIAMHPTDPETLIVATWERRRDAFDSFRGDAKKPEGADDYAPAQLYGPGGGLYRTTNGGKDFTKLGKGLPAVKLGRIGLDFSRSQPDTIFAIVDTEKAGAGNPPPPAAESGYLGVVGEDDPKGAKLVAVTEGSPAEKAGLKVGDVVTRLDGIEVKEYQQMVGVLRKKKPKDKVKATVLRGKNTLDVEITLGARPGGKAGPVRPSLGIQMELAKEGFLISQVLPKSPAEKAGLKVDDIITHVDGAPVLDRGMIRALFFGKKVGDKAKITFLRAKEKKEVEVTLEAFVPVPGRPNGHALLGGQVANAQSWQGPEGVDTGGLFKSTDRGETWTRINSINPRPFYFSVVRVDPTDVNTIYVAGIDLWRSTDGGKKFSPDGINAGLHADQHDLWIDPNNNKHVLVGCDGGFYVSYDRAANWEHLNRLALGQFYHVCVDDRRPYRVYGGLQDNGSWGGPSNSRKAVGPTNDDWVYVNGGDGFQCQVDLANPNLVYAESQDGSMMRRNLRTGASNSIRPFAQAGRGGYRFNWNTPFILSRHNSGIFYAAGNVVFRSVEHGDDLKPISPEISRTKRGTGTALAESSRNPDVLWVGTDDGAVRLTRDGGRTWVDVSANFEKAGLPGPRWVASIEASRWEEGRAYVVFDGHRSDDDEPYVFVTNDFGQSWQSLRGKLPSGSTRVLREDLYVKDLLYLGTEFAIWTSIDRGKTWTKLNGNTLPTVAIHEIAQPSTANEIVVATHGRSIWILDVAALRQLTPAVVNSNSPKLLSPPTTVRWLQQPGGTGPFAESMRRFIGANPVRGAVIDYVLPKKAATISLKIADVSGRTVAELKAGTEPGLHRLVWNMQTLSFPRPKGVSDAEVRSSPLGQALFGTSVTMGTYRVVLAVDGAEQSAPLIIESDPNAPRSADGARDEVEEERALRRLEKKLGMTEGEED
jgi:photosystem II stability/assembly factor-like uncharacterized protein